VKIPVPLSLLQILFADIVIDPNFVLTIQEAKGKQLKGDRNGFDLMSKI
jgi:hypothetical protein